jgi:hypothetical protein
MEITCSNCHQTWRVSSGHFLAAKLKFAFGAHEHAFVCPNCHAKNVISKHEFEVSDPQLPVTGNQPEMQTYMAHPPRAANDGASPPTNPVTAPEPSAGQYHAVVLERGLHLLRDHNPTAEIMGKLRKGEEVTIVDTWVNGDEVWVQIGPERWTTVEQDGEALIELKNE